VSKGRSGTSSTRRDVSPLAQVMPFPCLLRECLLTGYQRDRKRTAVAVARLPLANARSIASPS